MKTAPAPPAQVSKRCQACNKDVAQEPRMKDKRGQYWCVKCGQVEEALARSSTTIPCPICKKAVSAKDLVKRGDLYVCEVCFANPKAKAPESSHTRTLKIAGALGLLALGAVLILSHLSDLRSLL